MADPDNNELKPHYYRDNFLRLCDTVEGQYADLLAPGELLFLRRQGKLSSSRFYAVLQNFLVLHSFGPDAYKIRGIGTFSR
jgi:hypothetical protein